MMQIYYALYLTNSLQKLACIKQITPCFDSFSLTKGILNKIMLKSYREYLIQ